ncbi:hypothetical protein ACFWTC_35410 [Streptomyces sp. NPDC058619]|uniref:hypothetical protein n=1 Tax=Streptomyces sp. NPDC058619 TaxID=3346559 RepID=UPI003649D25C
MQHRDENTQRATEPVLTTEDLARPAPIPDRDPGRDTGLETDPDTDLDTGRSAGLDTGREAAVYPGEATGDAHRPGPTDDEERSTEGDAYRADGAPAAEAEADRTEETGTGGAVDGDAPSPSGPPGDAGADGVAEPLLGTAEAEGYRSTWSEIQGRFVDDPREAVRSADTLVAEVMQAFAGTLADHRGRLEKQWDSGEQVATEDLRQALRAYRSLINRLLDT